MCQNDSYCDDLPVLLNWEDALQYFEEHGRPTVRALNRALARVGRSSEPDLFFGLFERGLLTEETCRRCVGSVWSGPESPEALASVQLWLRAFLWAGYTVDGEPADRPELPVVLYRGATFERRRGMSWTDELEVAEWFATRVQARGSIGAVWQATVEPRRLLARNINERRGESEYVIDTRRLAVSLYKRVPHALPTDDVAT